MSGAFSVDFSVGRDLDRLVTWQYDGSPNLCGVVDVFKAFWDALSTPWTETIPGLFGIMSREDAEGMFPFILTFWTKMLGISRPTVAYEYEGDGETKRYEGPVSDDTMWRIVVGRLRFLAGRCEADDFEAYCALFTDGDFALKVDEPKPMTIAYGFVGACDTRRKAEWRAVFEQWPRTVCLRPTGVLAWNRADRFFTARREGVNSDTANLSFSDGGPFRNGEQT